MACSQEAEVRAVALMVCSASAIGAIYTTSARRTHRLTAGRIA
jgi:hypothetical protein